MDTRTILSKIVILIYKTRLLNNLENDELIRTVLGTMKTDAPEFNFLGNNSIKKFKDTCLELLKEKDVIPKEVLLPQLAILLENDQKLYAVIRDSIEAEHDESTSKRITTNLVKTLNSYYREHLAIELVNKANYDLKFNRSKVGNVSEYLRNVMSELEPYTSTVSSLKDPAVVNEVDFENSDSIRQVFQEVRDLNNNKAVYKLGWQAINRMVQGGARRGELIGVAGLEHRYKSAKSNSLFCAIATENTPILTAKEIEEKKIPLLLVLSFEDSLPNRLQFMYQYLRATDGNPVSPKEIAQTSVEEMQGYVQSRLTATGFRVKMRRIDPSQWSYLHLFNYVIELEAQGYSIHAMLVDYITLLPTTGCIQGAMGADKRDLVRRIHNFCGARGIICISPLQLGPEVRQWLRNGVPEHQIVKECVGKSPLDSSKSINQELDILIYVHLFTHKRKRFLAVALDRHRLPSVAEEDDRFYMLKFAGNSIPLAGDLHREDSSFKVLPKDVDAETGGGLLEEMLG